MPKHSVLPRRQYCHPDCRAPAIQIVALYLLACLVEEVTLQLGEDDRTEVVIHWRGGRADSFSVKRQKRRPVRRDDDIDTVELVRRLARFYPDAQVATLLNGQGRRSARGLWFSTSLVQDLRRRHGIPEFKASATDEGDGELLSVKEAARELGISDATLYRWINAGILPGVRPDVSGAPLRVRMGAGFRSRFHLDPPEGFVPLREAMQRLGVSRQTIWQRAASGQLETCHVKRGGRPRPLRPAGGGRASALRRNAFGPGAWQCMMIRPRSHSVKVAASGVGRRFEPPETADGGQIAVPGPESAQAASAGGLTPPSGGGSGGRNGVTGPPPPVRTA